jgi:hypothetical protein
VRLLVPFTVIELALALPKLVCPFTVSEEAVRLPALVVARVVGPCTTNAPVDVAPESPAKKPVFSVHDEPFQ